MKCAAAWPLTSALERGSAGPRPVPPEIALTFKLDLSPSFGPVTEHDRGGLRRRTGNGPFAAERAASGDTSITRSTRDKRPAGTRSDRQSRSVEPAEFSSAADGLTSAVQAGPSQPEFGQSPSTHERALRPRLSHPLQSQARVDCPFPCVATLWTAGTSAPNRRCLTLPMHMHTHDRPAFDASPAFGDFRTAVARCELPGESDGTLPTSDAAFPPRGAASRSADFRLSAKCGRDPDPRRR
jgi:hypothetical protein